MEKKDEFLSSEVAEESSATSTRKPLHEAGVHRIWQHLRLTRATTGSVGDGGGGGMMRGVSLSGRRHCWTS